jgi:hypothetical protein
MDVLAGVQAGCATQTPAKPRGKLQYLGEGGAGTGDPRSQAEQDDRCSRVAASDRRGIVGAVGRGLMGCGQKNSQWLPFRRVWNRDWLQESERDERPARRVNGRTKAWGLALVFAASRSHV